MPPHQLRGDRRGNPPPPLVLLGDHADDLRGALERVRDASTYGLPLQPRQQEDAVGADHLGSEPVDRRHRTIELSAVDKPGFWERYGYHNNADFWQEQRYGF